MRCKKCHIEHNKALGIKEGWMCRICDTMNVNNVSEVYAREHSVMGSSRRSIDIIAADIYESKILNLRIKVGFFKRVVNLIKKIWRRKNLNLS